MRKRAVFFVTIAAMVTFVACDSTTGPGAPVENPASETASVPQAAARERIAFGGEWAPPDGGGGGGGGGGPGAAPLVEIVTPKAGEPVYCGQLHRVAWRVGEMPGVFRVTAEIWFENGTVYYQKLCERDFGATSLWWSVPDLLCQEAFVRVTVEFLQYRANGNVIDFGGEWAPPDGGGGGGGRGARGSWEVYLTQVAELDFGPIVQRRAHRSVHERD